MNSQSLSIRTSLFALLLAATGCAQGEGSQTRGDGPGVQLVGVRGQCQGELDLLLEGLPLVGDLPLRIRADVDGGGEGDDRGGEGAVAVETPLRSLTCLVLGGQPSCATGVGVTPFDPAALPPVEETSEVDPEDIQ